MLGMQWRIQGEGLGGGLPPLFLNQTEAQRAEKNFFAYRTPPPYFRFWIFTLFILFLFARNCGNSDFRNGGRRNETSLLELERQGMSRLLRNEKVKAISTPASGQDFLAVLKRYTTF